MVGLMRVSLIKRLGWSWTSVRSLAVLTRFGALCVFTALCSAQQTKPPAVTSAVNPRALLNEYCVTCHSQRLKTAGLVLDQEHVDLAQVHQNAEVLEKVVLKLRAGMMPPSGAKKLDTATRQALAGWLEGELDRTATSVMPAPGLHRLNRAEYANAVRDLLVLEVDLSLIHI